MMRPAFLVACMAAITTAAPAQAQIILNGGFETPVVSPGTFQLFGTGSTIGGAWTVLGTAGNGSAVGLGQTTYGEPGNGVNPFTVQEGLNALDLTGTSNQGLASGVRQNFATTIGLEYEVSFWVGRAAGNGLYSTPSTVDLSIDGGPRTPFTNSNVTLGTINWMQFTTSFVATNPTSSLSFFNGQLTNNYTGLDNVFVTPVPEPASLILTSLGLAGAVRFGRRGRGQK